MAHSPSIKERIRCQHALEIDVDAFLVLQEIRCTDNKGAALWESESGRPLEAL